MILFFSISVSWDYTLKCLREHMTQYDNINRCRSELPANVQETIHKEFQQWKTIVDLKNHLGLAFNDRKYFSNKRLCYHVMDQLPWLPQCLIFNEVISVDITHINLFSKSKIAEIK